MRDFTNGRSYCLYLTLAWLWAGGALACANKSQKQASPAEGAERPTEAAGPAHKMDAGSRPAQRPDAPAVPGSASASSLPLLVRNMGKNGVLVALARPELRSLQDADRILRLPEALAVDPGVTLQTLGIVAEDFRADGTMSGRHRVECSEVIVELSQSDGNFLLSAQHAPQPRGVAKVAVSAGTWQELAASLPEARPVPHREGVASASDLSAYQVDLDGDGVIETIYQAQAPILEADETYGYSVVGVASAGHTPALVGYAKGVAQPLPPIADASFPVMANLEAIADLDGDGTMEVLIMFDEGAWHYHHLVAYGWDKTSLVPRFEYVWLERDCYPEMDSWPRSGR